MSQDSIDVEPQVFGVAAAAGAARRMGLAKQLLEIDGRPLLDWVIEPFLAANLAGLVVVTQSAIARQLPPRPRLRVALNDDAQSTMIDSIRLGLRAWRESGQCAAGCGFLVCPGDHPGISVADVNTCVAAFRASPDRVIIATRGGRRGHPIVFPWADVALVESPQCDGGLNALPRIAGERTRRVECASDGVLRDIDTPADWERFLREGPRPG